MIIELYWQLSKESGYSFVSLKGPVARAVLLTNSSFVKDGIYGFWDIDDFTGLTCQPIDMGLL